MIVGASSGIGRAIADFLSDQCEELITVSRRPAEVGTWIATDVTNPEEVNRLIQRVSGKRIDGLLYLGGTWEEHAFTDAYDFEKSSTQEIDNVLNVNLISPIKLIQRLLPNLRASANGKIIIMGAAVGGLNPGNSREVANTSSKFGLRGLVFSIRETLRYDKIGITLINPGNVATPEVLNDLRQEGKSEEHTIPLEDLFSIIECVLRLSNRTNVSEIDVPSML